MPLHTNGFVCMAFTAKMKRNSKEFLKSAFFTAVFRDRIRNFTDRGLPVKAWILKKF